MQIDFIQVLIIQKTHAVFMLSIRHLIYVSIYVCCLKLIFLMNLKMIYILNHNIMLLATPLLQIYQIMSFMECMKLVIAYMLLFWHYFITPHALHYMSILFHRGISYTDIFVF